MNEVNNKHCGGLTESSIWQKGTRTRLVSVNSEWIKNKVEMKAQNSNEPKKEFSLREILDRLELELELELQQMGQKPAQ